MSLVEVTEEVRKKAMKLLSGVYGSQNVSTLSQEQWDEYVSFLPKREVSDEPEFPEPEIELVQCSRCLHKQMADISQSIAIVCEWCDEVDFAYLQGDFVEL